MSTNELPGSVPAYHVNEKQAFDEVKKPLTSSANAVVGLEAHPTQWPEKYIMKGKQGSFEEMFGPFLEDRKPSRNDCGRCACITLCTITVLGGCYLCGKHYLIEDGQIGISLNDGKPEIYGPGRHVLISPVNIDLKMYPVTSPKITVGSLTIINVNDDQFGLAMVAGEPRVMLPGLHICLDPLFVFEKFINQLTPVLAHGSLHRIIVPEGQRGVAWVGNDPKVFNAGIYYFVSPLFKWVKSVKIDTTVASLDSFCIVTVDEGRVGIAYDRGVLRILKPGEHWLNAQDNQKFLDFLPTTQQVRQLKTLDVLTNDGLMVRIQGSITFRVIDPHKAVLNIGSDDENRMKQVSNDITRRIFSTIMRRANDTLASLLTGTSILTSAGMGFADSTVNVASANLPDYSGNVVQPDMMQIERQVADGKNKHKQQEGARDKNASNSDVELNALIRQRFKESLTHTLVSEWGVELSDMNVIDIEVMDDNVRHALAEGVRSNIVAVTDRKTAESKSETLRILAQGHRDAAKIKTDGETYAIEEVARAQHKAGQLLEQTPVAVDIRMAETAAQALSESSSSLVLAPDAGFRSIMSLIGSAQRMKAPGLPSLTQGPPKPSAKSSE